MDNIKVILNITLPGSVMFTKEAAKEAPKERTAHSIVNVSYKKYDKHTKKKELVEEQLHIFTRKCIPAYQSVRLSNEAYLYMISKESMLPEFKKAFWDNMSKKQRLEAHLKLYCQSLGGLSYTYDVLPD